MSNYTVWVCDRCGKKSERDRSWWFGLNEEYGDGKWLLCPDCKKGLLAYLKRAS